MNRPNINVLIVNSLWSTDSWWLAFGCSPHVCRTAECCLPRLSNTSTLNDHFVFTCCVQVRILFAFRCKPGFKEIALLHSINQACFVISSFGRLESVIQFGIYNRFHYDFFFFFSETFYVSLNVEKTKIRTFIKYFHLKGLKAKEIKSEPDSTSGKSSPWTTVKCWVNEFKTDRTST